MASALQSRPAASNDGDPIYLWPECVDIWRHWQQLQTQWRVGFGGNTGLDYAGVRAYLDELGIGPGEERREPFECFRAAEKASLEAWDELRARDSSSNPSGR